MNDELYNENVVTVNENIDAQIESAVIARDVLTTLRGAAIDALSILPPNTQVKSASRPYYTNKLQLNCSLPNGFEYLMDAGYNGVVDMSTSHFDIELEDVLITISVPTPDWVLTMMFQLGKVHTETSHYTNQSIVCGV